MLNRYELVMFCYLTLDLFYVLQKLQKYLKFTTAFSLKTESYFPPLIYFFSHKITSRTNYMPMYLRCPTLIQNMYSKISYFLQLVGIRFFVANISNLARILLVKVKNFEPSYLYKQLSYASIFR